VKKRTIERRARIRAERAHEPWHRLYTNRVWKALRAQRLADEPLCRMCAAVGKWVGATVVDHVKPHKGEQALFYDYENTQSLCKQHHDASKQSEERRGYSRAIGVDGWPTDERHPFNASGLGKK
jgi:5-methylcytosine-specific restriction enzyme A